MDEQGKTLADAPVMVWRVHPSYPAGSPAPEPIKVMAAAWQLAGPYVIFILPDGTQVDIFYCPMRITPDHSHGGSA